MGIVNFVLIAIGIVSMAYGYSRARRPWAQYQALKEQDANIARYESWRGGLRDAGTTGAWVAIIMAVGFAFALLGFLVDV